MEREELGRYLLRYLRREYLAGSAGFMRYNVIAPANLGEYSGNTAELAQRLSEAWTWLEVEGFIVYYAEDPSGNKYVVTDRGRAFVDSGEAADPATFRTARYLPTDTLHPRLQGPARSAYVRGEYDTAIFEAFKAVEVEVRRVGRFMQDDIGVPLMRAAFNVDGGPLRDTALLSGEQEATSHLFSGAMGLFRNASGHRELGLTDPVEVAAIIKLADVLLRMVGRAEAQKIGA